MLRKNRKAVTAAFLAVEAVLYLLILTTGGTLLAASSYGAIVVCFLFALLFFHKDTALLTAGLACTVGADLCLVVMQPIQRLWGMVFFLGAQSLYALWLGGGRGRWSIRIAVSVAALALTGLVLKENTDALALISVCYYGNLILNLLYSGLKREWLLLAGFALFLLCDTVIGLQVASQGYLHIGEGTVLHQLLFSNFNLAWFFYLPSQVLLALRSA